MSFTLEDALPMKLDIAFSLYMFTSLSEWTIICLDFILANISLTFGFLEALIIISEWTRVSLTMTPFFKAYLGIEKVTSSD